MAGTVNETIFKYHDPLFAVLLYFSNELSCKSRSIQDESFQSPKGLRSGVVDNPQGLATFFFSVRLRKKLMLNS